MWFVYLLYSKNKNIYYVGSTKDLAKRLTEHNSGKSKFTSMTNDWIMLYSKEFHTESEARKYERQIKRNKKYRQLFYKEASVNGLPV